MRIHYWSWQQKRFIKNITKIMKYILAKPFIKNARIWIESRPRLKDKIENCVIDFSEKVFESKYYRKKILWYKDIHELEIWWDLRFFVQIIIIEDMIKFLNIWTHSQLNTTWSSKIKLS